MAEYNDSHERCNRTFFKKLKKKQNVCFITKLKNKQGICQEKLEDKMSIVKDYYDDLFKKQANDMNIQQYFLDNIPESMKLNDNDAEMLQKPISMNEVKETINLLKENKSPGPDGMSAEFYKRFWNILGNDFFEVMQEIFEKHTIEKEMKLGYTTLIYKKGETEEIKNYRPISLLNTDYKILTKLLANRLKNVLGCLINSHQSAVPGRRISDPLTILRDVCIQEMSKTGESSLLSLDFNKAFDSIDLEYLFAVLKQFGFKDKILKILQTLYNDSETRILVNGYLSKTVQLDRGIRQGDPLSLFMFVIAIEPLLISINKNVQISGIMTPFNQEIKILGFADDITLLLRNEASIHHALYMLNRFQCATGMKLNLEKTKLLKLGRWTTSCNIPNISTVQNVHILGIVFSNKDTIEENWKLCLNKAKIVMNEMKDLPLTYDGKCLLIKLKVLPLFLYCAKLYPMPSNIAKQINKLVENFVFDYNRDILKIETICKSKSTGGYDIINIPIFTFCLYAMTVYDYYRDRTSDVIDKCRQELFNFIEYNIGQQLSVFFKLPINNSVPHSFYPHTYYSALIEFIKKYNFVMIDFVSGTHRTLYNKIVNYVLQGDRIVFLRDGSIEGACSNIHLKILPNKIKTFNYKLMWDILPLKVKPRIRNIAGNDLCVFCSQASEFVSHLFWNCRFTQNVYDYVFSVALKINRCVLRNTYVTFVLLDLTHQSYSHLSTFETNVIILLLSITRYKIWLERNAVIFQNVTPNVNDLILKIKNSLKCRRNVEKYRKLPNFSKELELLCNCL